ncbi:MAG: hypothetical protein ACOVMQ_06555 [Cyclobacteriaceae bacterium]
MKSSLIKLTAVVVLFYLVSYVAFRNTHIEVWQKDGKRYLIFPNDQIWIYYFYRPLTYFDGKITSLQFHIGPHQ